SAVLLELSALGFGADMLIDFRKALHRPNGILLVTGPTGSGKTTTLYAALSELNSPEKKILTIEDPIEYELKGINQVEVKPQIELTFARALRSFLRQDPDIIMVGEIRDAESAKIAVESALTGHLVLSTLHTNSAAATITRLLEMGIKDYLLTSTLVGVLAQRLVRRICTACREPYQLEDSLAREYGLKALVPEGDVTIFRGRGCKACHESGYRGRTNIGEFLLPSESITSIILRSGEAGEIERAAVQGGMRTLYLDGLKKILEGVTSLEEVVRTAYRQST
ncbi:GspE/PulE family protein, partial [Candidatus Magnetaquicoccus inordinatus]|uniref:GspE/PulE family protein n=1 Tax=Candidatus Magnetaquicoccus inordinatus TaxID=2496818 RepID=UPI00187D41F3